MGRGKASGITFEAPKLPLQTEDYVPKTPEEMQRGREQKEWLFAGLTNSKTTIERIWMEAKKDGKTKFEVSFKEDLTGGKITQQRVADIVRQWAFETYKGKLALERYDSEKKIIVFRFSEETEFIESR